MSTCDIGHPSGTVLTELRPGRTRGQICRLLDDPSEPALSIIKLPAAECTAEDVLRGPTCFGPDIGASQRDLGKISTNGSQAPFGIMNDMGPKTTFYKEAKESTTHGDV